MFVSITYIKYEKHGFITVQIIGLNSNTGIQTSIPDRILNMVARIERKFYVFFSKLQSIYIPRFSLLDFQLGIFFTLCYNIFP